MLAVVVIASKCPYIKVFYIKRLDCVLKVKFVHFTTGEILLSNLYRSGNLIYGCDTIIPFVLSCDRYLDTIWNDGKKLEIPNRGHIPPST